MTERRPRFARVIGPTSLVLTPRDREILVAAARYQWLTRPQIQRLFDFPSVTRTNQRLRKLFDAGYLDRLQVSTVNGGSQPVYTLNEAALPLVAEAIDPPLSRQDLKENRKASAALLPHDLVVNDVRVALTRATRHHPDLELMAWLSAREAYDDFEKGRSLRPDGYFCYKDEKKITHSFFLEVDRGTVSLERWKAKVFRYLHYRQAGSYRKRYGLTKFRVLTTTTSHARLNHLLETTATVTDRSFWFALTDFAVDEGHIATPIWMAVGQEGARCLPGFERSHRLPGPCPPE